MWIQWAKLHLEEKSFYITLNSQIYHRLKSHKHLFLCLSFIVHQKYLLMTWLNGDGEISSEIICQMAILPFLDHKGFLPYIWKLW